MRGGRAAEGDVFGIRLDIRYAWGLSAVSVFFFFQAEDGIRDVAVTGVQTCALPILENAIGLHRPDVVVAQGDTTTVMVTALTAFYLHVPFAHVEAGLRTGNLQAPFRSEERRVGKEGRSRALTYLNYRLINHLTVRSR